MALQISTGLWLGSVTRMALAVFAVVALAAGCAAESGTGGAGLGSQGLRAGGAFSAAIDGGNFTVAYDGLEAKATMMHRINKDVGGLACVPSLSIEVARPDGSCKLQLDYQAGFAGEGLVLKTASFYAKSGIYQDDQLIQTIDCPGWATEPAKGVVVYTSTAGTGSLPMAPLGQPNAGLTEATLRGVTLKPTFAGPLTMRFKGRTFDVDLSKITFTGDVVSKGDENVACVKTFHDFPQWELKDINPGSPGFDTTYGLDAFKGKKVVVALVSDWCASCIAQAADMQKLQDEANASGKSDVVMLVINDKASNTPKALTAKVKTIPVFQDNGAVDAWAKMNAPFAGKFAGSQIRNSGYGYANNGKNIMYFAPNGSGSLDLTAFQNAVRTVINAKDEE